MSITATYVSRDQLKAQLGMSEDLGTDTHLNDLDLDAACLTASRWIDDYCARSFNLGTPGEVRTFSADNERLLRLPAFCDLAVCTKIATDEDGDGVYETVWPATSYQLQSHGSGWRPEVWPWTKVLALGSRRFPIATSLDTAVERVQITGTWGWPAVPASVTTAATLRAAMLYRMRDAPLGIAGFGEMGAVRVRDNPMIRGLIDRYARNLKKVA